MIEQADLGAWVHDAVREIRGQRQEQAVGVVHRGPIFGPQISCGDFGRGGAFAAGGDVLARFPEAPTAGDHEQDPQAARGLHLQIHAGGEGRDTRAGGEGERTELTRRRDELSSNLATVTGERDSLSSQLNTAREDVARRTEQIAAMFTREQLDTEINAKNKMEDSRNDVTNKYVQLYNWIQNNTGSKPPYPRDPNYVDNGGVKVDAAPETLTTRIVAISPSQGLISFSVGEEVGVRADAGFEILVNDRSVGKVRISEVSPSFCVAQILPNTNLEALARGQVLTLVPFTGKVTAK